MLLRPSIGGGLPPGVGVRRSQRTWVNGPSLFQIIGGTIPNHRTERGPEATDAVGNRAVAGKAENVVPVGKIRRRAEDNAIAVLEGDLGRRQACAHGSPRQKLAVCCAVHSAQLAAQQDNGFLILQNAFPAGDQLLELGCRIQQPGCPGFRLPSRKWLQRS